MNLALLGDFLNFLKAGFRIPILQIEPYGIIEQYSILGDHTDILPEGIKLEVFQVLTID